ncbi:MAG: hypothetical protein JNK14_15525 [Chitinophagaceae bacterium]|nr:hypothetical protein [Chitinophagaceae bacterium]
MKFIVAVILTASLAFAAGLWFDWWSIAIAAFIVALLVHQKAGKAFLAGFTGLFILWGGFAWWMDMQNESILSKKIAATLPLGGNAILLIVVTALVGALVAGFGAMSGSYLRSSNK